LIPGRKVVLDLLDDWELHQAFQNQKSLVRDSYKRLFERADHVFANSEGTIELASRYGRDDAQLLLNGCDPDKFISESRASGPITIGYVGKIGSRLDIGLISNISRDFPQLRFVFAGPILNGEFQKLFKQRKNIDYLGDVPYEAVPNLLASFDLGWIPHSVGENEVGGDAIKLYEYRASGLPVLTTPIIGASDRFSSGVTVCKSFEMGLRLERIVENLVRIPRQVINFPVNFTWKYKSEIVLEKLKE
jgi:glycosyltransferase involved in cell wall biosynthesis